MSNPGDQEREAREAAYLEEVDRAFKAGRAEALPMAHHMWRKGREYEVALAARGEPRLTHGRHCPCSACAAEDWTRPELACCGMHGPTCPPVYAPLNESGIPETLPHETATDDD